MNALQVVVAIAAFLVTLFQWRVARAQRAVAEVVLLRTLSDDWHALSDDWRLAIGIERGVGAYYNETPWDVQAYYLALKRRGMGSFYIPDEPPRWPEEEFHVDPAVQRRVDAMSDEQAAHELRLLAAAVPRVVHYLAQLAAAVLSGRARPDVVYQAFGSQLLNSAYSIRVLSRVSHYDYMLLGYHDKIIALLDVLWSEAVRVDDVDPAEVAEYKQASGSGRRNRLRVRRLALRHSGRLNAARLVHSLTWAEAPGSRRRRLVLTCRTFLVRRKELPPRRPPSWALATQANE